MEISNWELKDSITKDSTDKCYKFAEIFTILYDIIAKYYPCFSKLKEAYKALAIAQWFRKRRVPIDIDLAFNLSEKNKVLNSSPTANSLKYEYSNEIYGLWLHFLWSELILSSQTS